LKITIFLNVRKEKEVSNEGQETGTWFQAAWEERHFLPRNDKA
jgi:hypothetical protein